MGNDQSSVIDEERKMLESLYQIEKGRLDTNDPEHVNTRVNAGTSASNCQPSHTLRELEDERRRREKEEEEREAEYLAQLLDDGEDGEESRIFVEAQRREMRRLSARDSQSSAVSERTSSERSSSSQQQQLERQGSIGSYVQMAKNGYQELVNAIIR